MSSAGRAPDAEIDRDTPMTRTYVRVLVIEAAILVLLWIFGRLFS